jgi:hypothetical protein
MSTVREAQMHIYALRVKNFRRLKDARIDLENDISIFVGANNSGKTSAAQAIAMFLGDENESFTVHDFAAETWTAMNAFGNEEPGAQLPTISLDLWLSVDQNDLYRVVDLLPKVTWEGTLVGVRVELAAKDPDAALARFKERRAAAMAAVIPGHEGNSAEFNPSPKDMREYLASNIKREFGLRYYVLDRSKFDDDFAPVGLDEPKSIDRQRGKTGQDILSTLVRVDMLYAQRHLSDTAGGARAEDLTKRISRIYARGAAERDSHPEAIRALMAAEGLFNEHLREVFDPFLKQVGQLGYPGVANPRLVVKSTLNPIVVLNNADGAQVHYALGEPGEGELTLPDRYNGLGYKNLIYMVIELFDIHSRWLETEENRPPLHLIFIEEPEAHLHMQLQQVFIRKVLDIVKVAGDDVGYATSQIIVTTHSSHIVYERGFVPVRYFRREGQGTVQQSKVLNLSRYYQQLGKPLSDFLVRYMKLTHCDLFFADAAILVEGNVERILLPQMIDIAAPELRSAYISVMEVGGAYAHVFRSLIEFIGIITLVITDIDSVYPVAANDNAQVAAAPGAVVDPALPAAAPPAPVGAAAAAVANPVNGVAPEPDDDEEVEEGKARSACVVSTPGAVTSNRTLIEWLPGLTNVDQLLAASTDDRTREPPPVRVVYQNAVSLTWNGETKDVVGRTLEEAFALENFVWCQNVARKALNLRLRGVANLTVDQIVERIHRRVSSTAFKKTTFALGLLEQDPSEWVVPRYMHEGLQWLAGVALPQNAEAAETEIQVELEAAPAAVVGAEPAPAHTVALDQAAGGGTAE